MQNKISVYPGVKPTPSTTVDWAQAIENIRSGKYEKTINRIRTITNIEEYREAKKKLPAVTFGGTFNGRRNRDSVMAPTGFIVADLDHTEDVQKVFSAITTDENVWFAFTSPGGKGIKCGFRGEGITSDTDHKRLYYAIEKYFRDVYSIKIDESCKDISRLTFMSYDPHAYINPNADYFDYSEIKMPEPGPSPYPARITPSTNPRKLKYGQKVLDGACNKIRNSEPGEQHHARLDQATLIGGYIATGYIGQDETLSALEQAVIDSGAQDIRSSMKTVMDGIRNGMAKPLDPIKEMDEERIAIQAESDGGGTCNDSEHGQSSAGNENYQPAPGNDRLKTSTRLKRVAQRNHYNRTDIGNAERLVDAHGQDLRYCHPFKRWYIWNGKCWGDDNTGELKRRCKDVIRGMYSEARRHNDPDERKKFVKFVLGCETKYKVDAMATMAEAEPSIPIMPDELDTNPWLFNCNNGTVDLKTGRLHPHQRADLISRVSPFDYDPDARCDTWLDHLAKVMAGDQDLIGFLRRAFGYSLTGDTSERVLFIQWGEGANGKSITNDCIADVVGEYAMRTPTETLLVKYNEGIPNDIARLMGARFVYAAEAEQGKKLAEAAIKDMTGGEKIAARFMRGEWFEFYPEFKIWLGTNHKPVIKGTDNAIWDRIRLIPYDVRIPENERLPKHTMLKLFREEAPGILAWLVHGCLEWQKTGLIAPDKVLAATQEYRTEMDIVGNFISECCKVNASLTVTAKKLYEAYDQWSRDNGDKPMSKKMFGMKLREQGFDSYAATNRITTYIGLELLSNEL